MPSPPGSPAALRRDRLRAFAAAAHGAGRPDLAERALSLAGHPAPPPDLVRALAHQVPRPALPDGLNPRAVDSGVAPATQEERWAYGRQAALHDCAVDLRVLIEQ